MHPIASQDSSSLPSREDLSRVIGKALDGFSKNECGDFVALQAERIYDIAAVAVIQHLRAMGAHHD